MKKYILTLSTLLLIGGGCGSSKPINPPPVSTDTDMEYSHMNITFTCPAGWRCGSDEYDLFVVQNKDNSIDVSFDEIDGTSLVEAAQNRSIDLLSYTENTILEDTAINGGYAITIANIESPKRVGYDIVSEVEGRFIVCKANIDKNVFQLKKETVQKLCTTLR